MSRHKYELMQSQIGEKIYLCSICECQKTVSVYKGFKITSFIRNNIFFDKSPECVDMAKENLKTID